MYPLCFTAIWCAIGPYYLLNNARDREIVVYSPQLLVDCVIWFGWQIRYDQWSTATQKHNAVSCFCYRLLTELIFTTNTVLVWISIVIFNMPANCPSSPACCAWYQITNLKGVGTHQPSPTGCCWCRVAGEGALTTSATWPAADVITSN